MIISYPNKIMQKPLSNIIFTRFPKELRLKLKIGQECQIPK